MEPLFLQNFHHLQIQNPNVVHQNPKKKLKKRPIYKKPGFFNSSLSSFEVSHLLNLDPSATKLLQSASSRLNLSARSYFKTIKVAQTIADLDGSDLIRSEHIAEALTFRKK